MKRTNITLQFVPYAEIAYLSSYKRIKYLLDLVAENNILLIQGRLSPQEEADLIEETMKHIRGSKSKFKGIELATFTPKSKSIPFFQSVMEKMASTLLGDRDIITIIGPATIVREIKKDPTKIQLLLQK